LQAAARIVLQDWNDGRIPFFTRPPQRGNQEHEEAAVVASWAADFDADKVFANEASAVIAQLPSMEDAAGVGFFEAASAGQVAVQLEEMEQDGPAAGAHQEEDLESMDEGYGAPSTSGRAAGGSSKAADALYGEEGQFNPHAARADRKRQKKAKKAGAAGGGGAVEDDDDDGSDFDFDAANEGLEEEEVGGQ
jgi:nuclear GTP-binding protein